MKRLLRWQEIFIIEASGFRTAATVVVPLIVGQMIGHPGLGLTIGAGGLQVAFTDQEGATPRTLLLAVLGCVAAAFFGGLASNWHVAIAVPLIALLAFTAGMLTAFGNVAGNLGFILLLTYASSQSLPIMLHQELDRLFWFGIGGFWAMALTLLLWRLRRVLGDRNAGSEGDANAAAPFEAPPSAGGIPEGSPAGPVSGWRDLLGSHLTWSSPVFQHALRLAAGAAIAVAIGRTVHAAHSFWLVLTVLVIIKPEFALTRRRALERVLGSVAGGIAAIWIVLYFHDIVALDLLIGIFALLAFSNLPRNYGLYVFFLTPFIVLLTSMAIPSDGEIAFSRMYQTLLGGGLGLAVAFLLRSPREWLPFGAGAPRSPQPG